ncbi:unnamed protein product [Pleuronectes platessa]|uniref:Uncharacterized protein n=1 Tax=Pleuronectes platessa TaxID=8262 RepID=A0A9N7YFM5_PLEPL|nr:unnamed protein product [Pleuronectes platessa]
MSPCAENHVSEFALCDDLKKKEWWYDKLEQTLVNSQGRVILLDQDSGVCTMIKQLQEKDPGLMSLPAQLGESP